MLQEVLQQVYFQNSIEKYITALFILVITLFVLKLFDSLALKRLKIWAQKSTSKFDEFIINNLQKTLMPVVYFVAFYFSIRSLILNSVLSRGIDVLGIIIFTTSSIRFLIASADYAMEYVLKSKANVDKERSLKAIMPILKVAVWGLGVIFLLDNLGFQISTVVAGLGIGGIAVALAAQAILGDLFSYVSIVFDRPFEFGDFITIGDHAGTIEHIGIKTTRIRSLSGEQLIFPNSDLTSSRVRNYKRMTTRRVLFRFGVIYSTTSEQLKEIPVIVRQAIEALEGITYDRAHFTSFGDSSLNFEVVYYVSGNDYNRYMDIQQEINLNLKEKFEQRRIEFAYPTQMVYLRNDCRDQLGR